MQWEEKGKDFTMICCEIFLGGLEQLLFVDKDFQRAEWMAT